MINKRKLIADQIFKEGEIWVIGGFLRVFKKVGKLYFASIADCSGEIQILFKEELSLRRESVLLVEGSIVKRKNVNPNVLWGEWELIVSKYEVLSESLKSLPFELIKASDEPLEATRLKYRYLDIRKEIYKNLILKSRVLNSFRNSLIEEKFIEVHTPSLSVSSKEGANTFDVEVFRDKKRAKFSLAQSPQLYKQLLMIGGLERYFQIANCFRLEDLRADRQYEFLQIDIEMSFSNQEKLFFIIEKAFKNVFREVFNKELEDFIKMKYDDALEKYGSDKPDIRHGLELENYSDFFKELILKNNHTEARGLFLSACNVNVVEDKWLAALQTKNDIYILHIKDGVVVSENLMKEGMPESSKNLVGTKINKPNGVLILITYDLKTRKNALFSLGSLRLYFSRKTKKELSDDCRFIWIIDWPLFEYNEIKEDWEIAHHLFTKPISKEIGFDKKIEKSYGYDLVINGVEIASGSVRNNDLEMQKYLFELANLSEKEIESNFGWFLEAFNYGVPPHLGIAIGVDRLIQVLLGSKSIREVIAFPKNNHGICPLTNSPSVIE